MGILGTAELKSRLNEIFKKNTASETNIDAASYDLRVAADGLFFGGKWYSINNGAVEDIVIKKGEVAVLSTIEEFTMPSNLVGNVNIKFRHARRGLISLFGSRVDPGYGVDIRRGNVIKVKNYEAQRLYLLVCNIGDNDIHIKPKEAVFIVEFHEVIGVATCQERPDNDLVMEQKFSKTPATPFGFVLHIDGKVEELKEDLIHAKKRIDDLVSESTSQKSFQKYFVSGVIVVLCVTLLGVAASFFLSIGELMDRREKYLNEVRTPSCEQIGTKQHESSKNQPREINKNK